jgi:hypothetical protein
MVGPFVSYVDGVTNTTKGDEPILDISPSESIPTSCIGFRFSQPHLDGSTSAKTLPLKIQHDCIVGAGSPIIAPGTFPLHQYCSHPCQYRRTVRVRHLAAVNIVRVDGVYLTAPSLWSARLLRALCLELPGRELLQRHCPHPKALTVLT